MGSERVSANDRDPIGVSYLAHLAKMLMQVGPDDGKKFIEARRCVAVRDGVSGQEEAMDEAVGPDVDQVFIGGSVMLFPAPEGGIDLGGVASEVFRGLLMRET